MQRAVDINSDESYGNEGWWNLDMAMQQPTLMSQEDANKLIGLVKEAYKQGVTKITLPDDSVADVDQDEIHRLAVVLRGASGQPAE